MQASPAGVQKGEVAERGDEPLSRAEEIRQRIAQRREELRRQAESQRTDPSQMTQYQSAIQNMINRKNENDEKEEKK